MKRKIFLTGLVLVLVLCLPACSSGKSENNDSTETTSPQPSKNSETLYAGRALEEALDLLDWEIDIEVSNKYDGYTINHDNSTITVNVWRESITNTVSLLQDSNEGADNEDWIWLKNNTKNTPEYIYDCMKTGELDFMPLIFNVFDGENLETLFLTVTDTDITYDILEQ